MGRVYFDFGRGRRRTGIAKDSKELLNCRDADMEIERLRTQDMMKLDGDARREALAKRRKQQDEIRAQAEGVAADFLRRESG